MMKFLKLVAVLFICNISFAQYDTADVRLNPNTFKFEIEKEHSNISINDTNEINRLFANQYWAARDIMASIGGRVYFLIEDSLKVLNGISPRFDKMLELNWENNDYQLNQICISVKVPQLELISKINSSDTSLYTIHKTLYSSGYPGAYLLHTITYFNYKSGLQLPIGFNEKIIFSDGDVSFMELIDNQCKLNKADVVPISTIFNDKLYNWVYPTYLIQTKSGNKVISTYYRDKEYFNQPDY